MLCYCPLFANPLIVTSMSSNRMEQARSALRPNASSRSRHAADTDCLDQSGGEAAHRGANGWSTRPLCCRYLAVTFDTQFVAVRNCEAVREHELRWAIGVVADGQCEVLGFWWDSIPGSFNWAEVFAELTIRGVESIALVSGEESNLLSGATRTSYPAAKVLSSVGGLLRRSVAEVAPRDRRSARHILSEFRTAGSVLAARAMVTSIAAGPFGVRYPSTIELWSRALLQLEPRYALAPRLQRCIRRGEDAAEQLHHGLSRGIERHGCFVDQLEATQYVVFLERAAVGSGLLDETLTEITRVASKARFARCASEPRSSASDSSVPFV